ncbi:hypothetical protein ISN45_At02g038640 [Arabidopsis thaliana x Arabidopsis arenosa]|uniref:Uncharacterized protein n=2 Tax=Arabidopsis TaxID=3701 RepID=B3H5P0_ARATH|nr:hypothetical protein ISN45_At02g038640 [Arabidopsis thaliana x Arabidopsis arenosa]OAP08724.1 hypothetical protein AXX17_AT2G40850 [Arabidopsis thaliana]
MSCNLFLVITNTCSKNKKLRPEIKRYTIFSDQLGRWDIPVSDNLTFIPLACNEYENDIVSSQSEATLYPPNRQFMRGTNTIKSK